MPKEAEISCKNVSKCEDKSALKKRVQSKMDRTYQSIRKIQRAGITCKMIDKHFPTRYNKCRWNVCFIFSLRR